MNERYEGQTYYELLEVQPQAGPTDIYNAYQRARNTYSPSSPALYSMFTAEEAKELMLLIEEAYHTLSHQGRRREYDIKIGLLDPRVPAPNPAMTLKQEHHAKKTDDPWVGPVKVTVRPKDEAPTGFGRTKFTTYEINADFEKEIAAIEECDGNFLKKIREYKGVSLIQISDEIRVARTTLAAMENNELDALPVAVFTRGFVVQYARALSLDEKKLTEAYMKYFKARKGVR